MTGDSTTTVIVVRTHERTMAEKTFRIFAYIKYVILSRIFPGQFAFPGLTPCMVRFAHLHPGRESGSIQSRTRMRREASMTLLLFLSGTPATSLIFRRVGADSPDPRHPASRQLTSPRAGQLDLERSPSSVMGLLNPLVRLGPSRLEQAQDGYAQ